jgi:hypothetical protein
MPTSGARSITFFKAATPARWPASEADPRRRCPPAIAIHDDGNMQPFMVKTLHCRITSHYLPCFLSVRHLPTLGPTRDRCRTALQACALCYEIEEVVWSSVELDPGSELYQSIPRVKYMAAVSARKLVIAPTNKALSSSAVADRSAHRAK